MRSFEFDASQADKCTGTIKIKVPTISEKFRLAKECGSKIVNGELVLPENQLDMIIALLDLARPFFLKVDVKHEDGIHAKKADDLFENPEFEGLVVMCATSVLSGGKVGNG